jgi:hypothetical protein
MPKINHVADGSCDAQVPQWHSGRVWVSRDEERKEARGESGELLLRARAKARGCGGNDAEPVIALGSDS